MSCPCHSGAHFCTQCEKHMKGAYLAISSRRLGSNVSGTTGRFCNEKCLTTYLAKTPAQRERERHQRMMRDYPP